MGQPLGERGWLSDDGEPGLGRKALCPIRKKSGAKEPSGESGALVALGQPSHSLQLCMRFPLLLHLGSIDYSQQKIKSWLILYNYTL